VAQRDSSFAENREDLGRQAGGGASDKARELWRSDPFGFARSLIFRQYTDKRAWRFERNVGFVLGRLPEGWRIVDDVPVGDRGVTVDHVVVGPAGAFTLTRKKLTGKVWVSPRSIRHNGHPTDFLSKATREARRASEVVSGALRRPVDVRATLAILADSWTIRERPTDVFVGAPRGVKDWLLRQPAVLSPSEVKEIAEALSDPSTWTGAA